MMGSVEKDVALARKDSKLLGELQSIPMIQSSVQYYGGIKKKAGVFGRGIDFMEAQVGGAISLFQKHTWPGSFLDEYFAGIVHEIKEYNPILNQSTDKVIHKLKTKTVRKARSRTARILETRFGKFCMQSLNSAIRYSEGTLDLLYDDHMGPKVRPKKRSERESQTDFLYKRSPGRLLSSTEQQTDETYGVTFTESAKKDNQTNLLIRCVKPVLIIPLRYTVKGLRATKRYIYMASGRPLKKRKSHRKPKMPRISPEKEAEIEERKKKSPVFRRPRSFFASIKRMFGFPTSDINISDYMRLSKREDVNLSPLKVDPERKRKHSDISDSDDAGLDTESDEEDVDLGDINLDDYYSSDDDDYIPGESETDESISEESEESDVETAQDADGLSFIKEKKDQFNTKELKDYKNEKDASAVTSRDDDKLVMKTNVLLKKIEEGGSKGKTTPTLKESEEKTLMSLPDKDNKEIELKPEWDKKTKKDGERKNTTNKENEVDTKYKSTDKAAKIDNIIKSEKEKVFGIPQQEKVPQK